MSNDTPLLASVSASSGAGTSTAAAVTLPTYTVGANDLAVMIATGGSNTLTFTAPAGWTQVLEQSFNATCRVGIYTKKLVSGDSGTTVGPTLSGAGRWATHCRIYGRTASIDVQNAIFTGGASAGINLNATAVNALAETEETIVALFGAGRTTTAPTVTLTAGGNPTYGNLAYTSTTAASGGALAGGTDYVETTATGHGPSLTWDGPTLNRACLVFSLKAADLRPTVDAGADQSVAAAATVTLAATETDPDASGTGTWQWTQTGGPAVTLSAPTAQSTTFTAPTVGGGTSLTFQVVYTDAGGRPSNPDTVTVSTSSPLVPAVQWRNDSAWFPKPLKTRKAGAWQ